MNEKPIKALIVAASRYGSAMQGAEWIAERLIAGGVQTRVLRAEDAPPPGGEDLIVLGSGLYAHRVLPSLSDYIARHGGSWGSSKLALFVLAMQTAPVFTRGEAHGGLGMLAPLFKQLGSALAHADMLGGQMVFSQLNAEDAAGIERFYAMLKLSPAEIQQRKAPRTLMNKADYWAFAEKALKQAQGRP